jgi:hypothetical protein
MPGIGTLHQVSGDVQQWAQGQEPLNNPASAAQMSPTRAAIQQGVTGTLADVAGLVHGATSPAGVAIAAGAALAPEVVGPALVGHGVYTGVTGWGDLRNPDVLQNVLNAGAEVAGGAAMTGAGVNAVRGRLATRQAAQAPSLASADFTKAVPPTKSAPYQPADYQAARPYLEAEHAGSPITTVTELRDAADSAIGNIESQIETAIKNVPNAQIQTNPLDAAKQALSQSVRRDFVDAGVKELSNYPLDGPLTLGEADDIRWQLNQDNKAVLKRNNYDVATARATDPAFAAREAAAEALRNGIYDSLAQNGMPGAQQLRLDEGSLIKLRNAAQNKAFVGDQRVSGTAPQNLLRRMAGRGATIAGAALGSPMGPIGAAVGAEAGGAAATALNPSNLTRDALIERSFGANLPNTPAIAPQPTQQMIPIGALLGGVNGQR